MPKALRFGASKARFFLSSTHRGPALVLRELWSSVRSGPWLELRGCVSPLKAIRLGDANAPRRSRMPQSIRIVPVLLAIGVARPVLAQDGEVVTPLDLFEKEAGKGIRVGDGFVLLPEVGAGARYDTNVYNTATATRADAEFSLRPRVALQSDFSRHQLVFYGGADVRRFATLTEENTEAWDAGARARLELAEAINITPEFRISRGFEQRGTAGDQFLTDRPVAFTRKEYMLGIERGQHGIELALNGRIARTDFSNATIGGFPIDLTLRDYTYREGQFRVGYNLSPRFQVYSRIVANDLRYRTALAISRDSSGYAVLGGARIRLTSLLDVEVGAGYISQTFSNPAQRSIKAADYSVSAIWNPHPTWQLRAEAGRHVDPSPLANVPAIFRTSYRLEVRHVVGTRMLIGAEASHSSEAYRGLVGSDRRTDVGLNLTYRITPQIGATANIGYRRQDGGATGRTYNGAGVGIGIRVIG
ncbi:MAG: outer membrane beta-barrel protein [Sphingomonadales bacterium]|nr:outer membrane beta-barrel protein [Sphingomonadales bacterium]